MLKTKNLQPFYLLELTDTTPVSFDISTKKHLIMHGNIPKSEFYSNSVSDTNSFRKKVILSPNVVGNNSQKSVICLSFK